MLPTSAGLLPADLPAASSAFICYVDGDFPKAPPPDGDHIFPNYDRGVIVVSGDVSVLVQAAYKRDLPVVDPR